ncbi:hypothetical protein Cantr_03330 [Candida viswanathii]|uniref:Uncharacterized protein n=1 Tax=Candida viswanathii TaxID=5486 RepID=A0A367YMA4_9ASCO|nr:hypothetical protein Cantr_03330 [Candida viswanathii]
MPYEDSFKENTKFHSAHYFLNQFQSKDYEDSIIQLDNPPVEPTGMLPVVPTPVDVASSSSSKRLDVHSPQPRPQQTHHHHPSQPQHQILTLNTDINEYTRNVDNKNKKKLNHHSHNISSKDAPMSRSASASPCLISPILTNNESNTSPELELLEYDEDDDEDDDDDDEDDDDDDHEGELWDQDEIFQMHGDALANPAVPGLFPQMEIGVNEEFLDRDRLPIEPLVHQRQ